MNEAIEFITKCGTFYMATLDGDKPKVRPFGVFIECNGKIYSATANTKDVYKQLKTNPNFEISATSKEMKWIRISGKAIFDNNMEVKKKIMESMPGLKKLYGSPENPILEVFYIDEGVATLYSITSEPQILTL